MRTKNKKKVITSITIPSDSNKVYSWPCNHTQECSQTNALFSTVTWHLNMWRLDSNLNNLRFIESASLSWNLQQQYFFLVISSGYSETFGEELYCFFLSIGDILHRLSKTSLLIGRQNLQHKTQPSVKLKTHKTTLISSTVFN